MNYDEYMCINEPQVVISDDVYCVYSTADWVGQSPVSHTLTLTQGPYRRRHVSAVLHDELPAVSTGSEIPHRWVWVAFPFHRKTQITYWGRARADAAPSPWIQ
jgi:hypothetical protein